MHDSGEKSTLDAPLLDRLFTDLISTGFTLKPDTHSNRDTGTIQQWPVAGVLLTRVVPGQFEFAALRSEVISEKCNCVLCWK